MFTRLGDAYRRIRNTLRILLGNANVVTGIADPGWSNESSRQSPPGSATPATTFTLVDRWILHRLQEVISDCREAYAAYEFHKVYHTLNQFCAVDLSSLYVDITKDRLYCDAENSPRRRATQKAMRELFESMTKLLAPILAFTAEEAWSYLGSDDSVHIQEFPSPNESNRDKAAQELVDELLKLRGVIGQAVEQARQEKLIGNALEARVVLRCDVNKLSGIAREELEEFFILSDLQLEPAETTLASITRTPYQKCARCWRHREAVGKSVSYPDLCDRCETVVAGMAQGS
ncbi:MAG: class I tRNA ligase family protein [Chthoniobacterales bacterium]